MTDLNEQFSRALRDLMQDQGITQQQVADLLGRSQAYVSHRLIGRQALSADIAGAVAQIMHVTPLTLMTELTARMR